MKNLCINGEPITNNRHPDTTSFMPSYAFDAKNETLYISDSYVYNYHPYIGYDFKKRVNINCFYIYQMDYRYCNELYLIYSDNGTDWTTAEKFENVSYEETLTCSNDYGEHQYWAIQAKTSPIGEEEVYPWIVNYIEMYSQNKSFKERVQSAIANNILFQIFMDMAIDYINEEEEG